MSSFEQLEIQKIIEQIADQAVTSGGKEEVLSLRMITHRLRLERELNREKEALLSTIKQTAPSFSGYP